jgi:predicted DCC family thiol-disulfide oxidoreductase YuxK
MERALFFLLSLAAAFEVAARLLGRRSTRARLVPARHLLIYDDACGLCSFAANLVRMRLSEVDLAGFSQLPREGVLEDLDRDAVQTSVHLVTPEGVEYHGGEAVTRLLRLLPGLELVRFLDWPVLRGLREIGYRVMVTQRSRVSRLLGAR